MWANMFLTPSSWSRNQLAELIWQGPRGIALSFRFLLFLQIKLPFGRYNPSGHKDNV